MFSTHDPYDAEWEHPDTGRTASFSRDDCDETCQGTDDCDCAEMNAAQSPPAEVEHKIRHFVVIDGEKIPRTSTMRGQWACEAECSCGWTTRTGGAVRSFIDSAVKSHKWDVEHGFWTEGLS